MKTGDGGRKLYIPSAKFVYHMDIVIVGTGNTATVLGKRLKNSGHKIVQVFGRDPRKAASLAGILGASPVSQYREVSFSADLMILAVSDSAIVEVASQLPGPCSLVVHTAASISKDVLKGTGSAFGVFYPLQSLKKNRSAIVDIPILIDASDSGSISLLRELAESLSGMVTIAGDEERLRLHLAAVICNNFVNHLYVLAEQYCLQENLDFSLLLPLINETAGALQEIPASAAQTGPARRGDHQTIEKHLHLLNSHPQLGEIYRVLTKSIRNSGN
jgi:predicted short-subunit dehydrogenase-like oxidoreductase (DUF2520 family)